MSTDRVRRYRRIGRYVTPETGCACSCHAIGRVVINIGISLLVSFAIYTLVGYALAGRL